MKTLTKNWKAFVFVGIMLLLGLFAFVGCGQEPVAGESAENPIMVSNQTQLQDANNSQVEGVVYVKLSNDIVLTSPVTFSRSVNLDMNSKTIKNEADIYSDTTHYWSLISVSGSGVKVTVTGNGTFKAKENDCFAMDVRYGAQLDIQNGTYVGNMDAIYVYEGYLNVYGGHFSIQKTWTQTGKEYEFVLNCYDKNRANGTAKITVYGGEFEQFNPAANGAESNDNSTNFLATGYTVTSTTENGVTVYTVVAQSN